MINRDAFFPAIRTTVFHGRMDQSQVDGTNAILDAWAKWAPAADMRFIAYSLATTYHETAATMQPIEEYGKGAGRAYGVPTGPWHAIYDGRGDVQLTWEYNYAHATLRLRALRIIGADEDLEETPSLAMRPDIAAPIMIFGMIEGWFTGKKLADYFAAGSDWINARRIINGLDCAAQIALYGQQFHSALIAS